MRKRSFRERTERLKDQAFGFGVPDQSGTAVTGLTRREYFAGVALQGLLMTHATDNVCETAVTIADDLLAELDKPELEPGEPDKPEDPHYTGGRSL